MEDDAFFGKTVHLRRIDRYSVQIWPYRSGTVETNEKEEVNGECK